MSNTFGICVEDEEDYKIADFVTKENVKYLELHDWQKNAIKFFFERKGIAIFNVCTGAGKTFFAIELLKHIWKESPDARVLIVVPKNIIMETGWYKELYQAGIKLKDIGVFYGRIKEEAKVTITNIQSIKHMNLEKYDVLVADEMHNYGSIKSYKYLEHSFKYKIGLTATVDRQDGKHWDMIELFNYNVFYYNPMQALQEDILNPFEFVNISVEMDNNTKETYDTLTQELNAIMLAGGGFNKIMRSGSGLKFSMLSKLNERKDLINNYSRKADVVKTICLKHINDKVIVFNEYNKTTNKFYWYLLDVGVKSCIMHSDIPHKQREQTIIDFKNDKYRVMLTSRVLDEGYNLPKLDVAIIAAGNSTSRQTIQRMGRVLRKKDKESMLYQIYVRGTMEMEYAQERAKLFKSLCSNYHEYTYDITDEEFKL